MTTEGTNGNVIRINNICVGCKFDWSLMAPTLLLVVVVFFPLPSLKQPSPKVESSSSVWRPLSYLSRKPSALYSLRFKRIFIGDD